MAIPLLVILERIGLFPGATHWIDLAVLQLRRRREELLSAASPAAAVAEAVGWTVPLVHSSTTLGAAAALRWKTQVNENAKRPAFWALYPELCHNEVAGWGGAGVPSPLRGGGRGEDPGLDLTVVNLRHDSEHPQMGRRFALVGEVLAEAGAGVCEVWAEGEGELAQLLDLVLIGDFVSLHLAAIAGADPGPIPVLDRLKARLQEG
jgi:glucose/mannose-6-phosphate isomerase